MIAYAAETFPLLSQIQTSIINPLILLGLAAAVLVFLYGLFEMLRGINQPAQVEKGTQHIIWGVIGLAIMVSVFGFINLICSTIGAQC